VHFRLPPQGDAGYVGLHRGSHELAVTTVDSPQQLIGVQVGSGPPRFELFVYVDDVDDALGRLREDGDVRVLKEPQDMFWGERVGWVADPDGNPVALAMVLASPSG
jgi:lactoylglutathione lyase